MINLHPLIKTSVPGLLKDKKTNTFLNNNVEELIRAKAGRERQKEIMHMKREIEILKQQVATLIDLTIRYGEVNG